MKTNDNAIDTLTFLLVAHARSLPVYFEHAPPWSAAGQEPLVEVLRALIADHHYMEERLGRMLLDRRAAASPSDFPTRYADFNDISLEYAGGLLIEDRRRAIARIEGRLASLDGDSGVRAVAEEALGMARGHLQNLTETAQQQKTA